MGIASEDAARLQDNVEHWQQLASAQQGLAIRFEELVSAQRALTELWATAGDADLASAATDIEAQMRRVAQDVLGIQEAVLGKIAEAVSDVGKVLRAH